MPIRKTIDIYTIYVMKQAAKGWETVQQERSFVAAKTLVDNLRRQTGDRYKFIKSRIIKTEEELEGTPMVYFLALITPLARDPEIVAIFPNIRRNNKPYFIHYESLMDRGSCSAKHIMSSQISLPADAMQIEQFMAQMGKDYSDCTIVSKPRYNHYWFH